jgi:predicted DNA-binding transcriptional regulator AlpA
MINMSEARLLRLSQIVPHIIPVSKSTWWSGVKAGRFPKPIKLSSRVTVWRYSDIEALIIKSPEDTDNVHS